MDKREELAQRELPPNRREAGQRSESRKIHVEKRPIPEPAEEEEAVEGRRILSVVGPDGRTIMELNRQ